MPIYRKIWWTVYRTAGVNLLLLIGADLLVRYHALPAVWALRGTGLLLAGAFAVWTGIFIWLCAVPFSTGLRMVLREHISKIDYVFLLGIAIVTITYYALVYFMVLRMDPNGIKFMSNTTTAADLLYFSTVAFLTTGFDVMTATSWWPRMAMLGETLMGLGYLAGMISLLTNRLASEPAGDQQPRS